VKIAQKILEVMKLIPTEGELSKLNEVLIGQGLASRSEFEVVSQSERVDKHGAVWQVATVSCELIIIDTESDETIVNIALGQSMDAGDLAIARAQRIARGMAWMAALNLPGIFERVQDDITPEPEIIVETPESKLITQIRALWKWDAAMFPEYIAKRFAGRCIEDLNITELTVIADELRNYKG
jgi:hypothetical protein